jgi:uncharacterized protein
MTDFDTFKAQTDRPFIAKLMILVGLTLIFMFVGSMVGILAFSLVTGASIEKAATFIQHLQDFPNSYLGLMLLQSFSTPLPFIASSLFYWYVIEKQAIKTLSFQSTNLSVLVTVAVLVIGFMPFDAVFIELNQKMQFPEALKGIEEWMKNSENSTEKLTKFLTTFQNPTQFGLAMLIVAVFAGISEELLFRGVLQNLALKAFRNPHIAIWFAAFWFSFIHFQFFGFIPRMLLGAMFGYLYYWTQNLWLSIFAHFVNNGFTLLMAYLYQIRITKTDIEKTDAVPLGMAFVSCFFTIILLRWFWMNSSKKNENAKFS